MSKKEFPQPQKFSLALVGPGLVLIAMGLGSGEFVLWPYLAAQYGFGVLWGAVIGITLQFFVSNESGRYTLATGDSVFVGFRRLSKLFPIWFILSTFLAYGWPGIIGSGGEILGHILGVTDHKWLTVAMLLLIGFMLSFGGRVYDNMERFQKLFLGFSLPVIFVIAILLISPERVGEIAAGFVGIGDGYWLFPEGVSLVGFLGAVAYSGAGGNLVLSHSFYVQDEQLGMAKYGDSQIQRGDQQKFTERDLSFDMSDENVASFKSTFRNVALEQFLTFLVLGLVTIIMLMLIAYSLAYPFAGEEGLEFIYIQGERLGEIFHPVIGTFFMLVGVVFLFQTQLGVFESTSRIMSENLILASKRVRGWSRSLVFYGFVWSQVLFAIFISLLDLAAPLEILLVNTFFSAIAMFVLSGAILWLNSSNQMPQLIRTGMLRRAVLFFAFCFFGIFSAVVIYDSFIAT